MAAGGKNNSRSKLIFIAIIVAGVLVGSILTSHSLAQTNDLPISVSSGLAANGLQLQLSLSENSIETGASFEANIAVYNSLAQTNNVSTTSNWPLSSFPGGTCPSVPPPMVLMIYQGYYTKTNVSSATPLPQSPPGFISSCPPRNFNFFLFQPASDMVTAVRANSSTSPAFMLASELSVPVTLSGYYTAIQPKTGGNGTRLPSLIPFSQGIYTLAAGDEWGTLVLAYVEVT